MAKARDAFRTISEVSEALETPAHVLRFWESKFAQVKPVKRAGGRRYYRPQDVALLGGIKTLLHEQGMTIKAVQKMLRSEGVKRIAAIGPSLAEDDTRGDVIEHKSADNVVPLSRNAAPGRPLDETPPPEGAVSANPPQTDEASADAVPNDDSAGSETEADTRPSEIADGVAEKPGHDTDSVDAPSDANEEVPGEGEPISAAPVTGSEGSAASDVREPDAPSGADGQADDILENVTARLAETPSQTEAGDKAETEEETGEKPDFLSGDPASDEAVEPITTTVPPPSPIVAGDADPPASVSPEPPLTAEDGDPAPTGTIVTAVPPPTAIPTDRRGEDRPLEAVASDGDDTGSADDRDGAGALPPDTGVPTSEGTATARDAENGDTPSRPSPAEIAPRFFDAWSVAESSALSARADRLAPFVIRLETLRDRMRRPH